MKEMVGTFNADFYQINGMVLESRKRREHLSEEDLQKNKAIMESLTKGSSQGFTNGEVRSNTELPNFYLLMKFYNINKKILNYAASRTKTFFKSTPRYPNNVGRIPRGTCGRVSAFGTKSCLQGKQQILQSYCRYEP